VIDRVSVALNDKTDSYEAEFSNLGIKKVMVDSGTVKSHPKLLVSGVWCIADIEYEFSDEKNVSPWILSKLKPIQLSNFDFENYLASRKEMTTEEWTDLLIQSIGFNPEMLGKRNKLMQLIRLIPFCERNYNLMELGPKGTGKSHIYSEFSPHGMLVSGGEVTVPKLFVNNASGKIGLVGFWDTVAFDEFAGKQKKVDRSLVDIMKNYMANKSFSRGVETHGAEASMVFVGNTKHTVPYMLKNSDLFDELPQQFYDSAFLDRVHFYIPGWEIDVIRGEMFSSGYGFVVDYLAEILRSLRNHDYSELYKAHFTLSPDISTRDRDGIHKTFSGLMKVLYPQGEASKAEIEELLQFSIEGRKRVKDQLMRIDTTYPKVKFAYTDNEGKSTTVQTLEEIEYPEFYYKGAVEEDIAGTPPSKAEEAAIEKKKGPEEKHLTFKENQKGVSYEKLFADYLEGAKQITITDPYIRLFYQTRNLMELLELIVRHKAADDEITVKLLTTEDEFKGDQQRESLDKIKDSCEATGIQFDWKFDSEGTIHARHIVTDNGWKISLDRGLDIFQPYEMNDTFTLANRLQEQRQCKGFEVTYIQAK